MELKNEDLKKMLVEKEQYKITMENAYQQVLGQIAVIKDLIKKTENEIKKENIE